MLNKVIDDYLFMINNYEPISIQSNIRFTIVADTISHVGFGSRDFKETAWIISILYSFCLDCLSICPRWQEIES